MEEIILNVRDVNVYPSDSQTLLLNTTEPIVLTEIRLALAKL